MTTISHFSHPDHPLILKEIVDDIEKAVCYACGRSSSSDTYTCDICEDFFLHKTCAELPTQIDHPIHSQHSVTLLPHLTSPSFCDVCKRKWDRFTYRCDACDFDICVICSDDNRMFNHIGHKDHSLNLVRREAMFICDACGVEAKDSSYSCNTCDFWMHKSCASSSTTILMPTLHRHPMQLVFSVPDTHRNLDQFCGMCKKSVRKSYWSYYCRECTYFVHLRCATSSDIKSTTTKQTGGADMVKASITLLDVLSNLISCLSS